MNIIDKLSNMNIDINLGIKKAKSQVGSNVFDDVNINIDGIRVDIQEIVEQRKEMGLSALNLKVRQCLRCFNKFNSTGNHHRLCKDCKDG
jgi:hypothetical protein